MLLALANLLLAAVLPISARAALFCTLALVALASEATGGWLPLPQNHRQVSMAVLHVGPLYGPLWFGYAMGTGVRTYVLSALPHIVATGILFLGGPASSLPAAIGFAAGRAAFARQFAGGSTGADKWLALRKGSMSAPILTVASSLGALQVTLEGF